jgi:hypothetical protein
MTSPQHLRWISRGSQWQLAWPLVALRDRLRGYGYTVYDLGDTSHLDHIPPEDHTPYSETGWPGTTPYGWVTAIDIMPPPAGHGLPSLQALGAQLFNDKQAGFPGVAWLKYMNWGPTNNSSAVHDRWEPGHERSSSGDTGHIHLSCRSDATQSSAGAGYDPVARLRGQTTSSTAMEDIMLFRVKDGGDRTGAPAGTDAGAIYLATADGPKWIRGEEWGQIQASVPTMVCDSYARIEQLCPPHPAAAVKVDAAELAAALLAQPGFAAALADAAFQGAQRAESE